MINKTQNVQKKIKELTPLMLSLVTLKDSIQRDGRGETDDGSIRLWFY